MGTIIIVVVIVVIIYCTVCLIVRVCVLPLFIMNK